MQFTRVKRLFLSSLLLFAWFTPPAAFADETYQLRNQFKVDETQYLSLQTELNGETKLGERTIPYQVEIDSVMAFKPTKIEQNTAEVLTWVEHLSINDPDRRTTKNLYDKLGLKDKIMEMKINQRGKVLKHDKLDKLPMLKQMGLSKSAQSPTERRPWITLPENAVAIGDTWEETMVLPLPGVQKPIQSKMKYTLNAVKQENDAQIAVISYKNTISAENVEYQPNQPGMNPHVVLNLKFKEYKKEGTGTMHFNIDRGIVQSFNSSSDMTIVIEGQTGVGDAQLPMKNQMDFSMRSRGTVSATPPETIEDTTAPSTEEEK
ncbi:hypothetical protein GF373_04770 [bacterium]|nr:hypothetical protein [bacterium]